MTDVSTERLRHLVRFVVEKQESDDETLCVDLEHVETATGQLTNDVDDLVALPGDRVRFAEGDVLVSKLRPYLAKSWRATVPGAASSELMVLRPTSRLNPRWLAYVVQSAPFVDFTVATAKGVKMPRTSPEEVGDYRLHLPNLAEQQQLADFLDRETQRADATSRAFFVLSQLLAERLKSIVDSKVLPGPSSSDDWKRYRLKHLAASPITTGVGLPAEHEEYSWPRYIRTTDIDGPRSLRSDVFFSQPPELVDAAGVQKYDLLMTAAGTIGKTYLHLTDSPAVYAGYLARFRSGPHVEPRFVAFWAQSSDYWAQIEQGAVRSTIDNFSAGRYQNLEIWCPPLETQARIADELDAYVATHDEAQREIADLRRLTDERREAVITAAVTGKLRLETVA